jgi:hypothetical protein
VLFWSRATRDLLKSFGWGIATLHRENAATKLPPPRRPPHRISRSLPISFLHSATHFFAAVIALGCSEGPISFDN